LYRVMTDPERRGRRLGTLLMAGMHRIARDDGVELLQLGYRSGTGVSAFYAGLGYREVGRIPGAIRVGPDDDRDDVTMVRRVDGGPLVTDGRG
ncbi:MAG: GNAT family N-acetyltransferase, partial [Phycicoccus sp.]